MSKINDNTFAAACYDQNSIADLEQALLPGADSSDDCETWGLTPEQWRDDITLALNAKRRDSADSLSVA